MSDNKSKMTKTQQWILVAIIGFAVAMGLAAGFSGAPESVTSSSSSQASPF